MRLNELKYFTSETPEVLNNWIDKARLFADKISELFFKKKDLHDRKDGIDFLVKNGYISLDRFKNEFSILMTSFPKDRRFIVSYVLSTLLNNIASKKDGYKLFDKEKQSRAYVFIELALFVYSFCPCFDHTQKILSMLVYLDDELKFKNDEKNRKKLVNLIRRYSFIFEKANLNDICNWFIFFFEFKISLLKQSEDIIFKKIIDENNPILWANYYIYSQYNNSYKHYILTNLERIIEENITNIIPFEPLLQREFWYVLIFCNCPYLSNELKVKLDNKVALIQNSGSHPGDVANNLIYKFLSKNQSNLFFYWGYYNFNTCKQLTYRTYQRTLFKQYKNKRSIELYGSLDS